ncbi:IS701 family transposase [Bradyrhizobium liaoningense]|uniref:IS701 family transposase n=1 Tax=Bradyrhizobium liaoningense TaxID=43992 RepID=UPI001BAD76B8|nr:transposase [Bradyrhizobium liaoningense]MBR0859097.1 transposase [Bradyrhizobium liaoningense]
MSHTGKIAAVHRADSTDAMLPSRLLPSSSDPLPPRFVARLAGFADVFTRPTWSHVPLLLAVAILAPGRRTVAAALRILGRDREPDFCTFHRILNRAAWSSRAAAGRLLVLLVSSLVPAHCPVVIGLDDTIERRWGTKISARGIYRDPVRSSKGHFVKASGLRWLSAMLLVRVPWADRIMALPFLTLLAPSKRFYAGRPRQPKTLLDWARQAVLQISRWLPGRSIVLVADSAFAALEFLAAIHSRVCVVTRLRMDANLFDFPPPKPKGRGRPPIKGKAQKKLSAVVKDRKVRWQGCHISLWYGRTNRLVEIATGTALWYRSGVKPLPIRWLLVLIRSGNSNRKHSSPPTSTPSRTTSSPGSSAAGSSKSPSRKFALTTGSRPSASGRTRPFCGPRRSCSACIPSSHFGRTTSQRRASSNPETPPGIRNRYSPSAMRSRRSDAKYGLIKFPPCPGLTEMP